MNALKRIFDSTIGQKALVGLTGLALVGFLITHLAGNLLMYAGDDGESFNAYSQGLHDLGPLLYAAEIGLLVIFFAHLALVARLVLKQREAGGAGRYAVGNTKRASGAVGLKSSRTMAISGATLLVFIAVHIWDFRLQLEPGTNLFEMVKTALKEPWRMGLYVVGSFLVGWHIFHGFQSAFRSLGLNHSAFTPVLSKVGAWLGVIFGLGFASFPLWIFFTQ